MIGNVVREISDQSGAFVIACLCVCVFVFECMCRVYVVCLRVCIYTQCVCVYVCVWVGGGWVVVFVFISFHSKGLHLTEQNNKCNARDQVSDVLQRKYFRVKNLCRHVINNHSRDLQARNCAKECQSNREEQREVKGTSDKFSRNQQ